MITVCTWYHFDNRKPVTCTDHCLNLAHTVYRYLISSGRSQISHWFSTWWPMTFWVVFKVASCNFEMQGQVFVSYFSLQFSYNSDVSSGSWLGKYTSRVFWKKISLPFQFSLSFDVPFTFVFPAVSGASLFSRRPRWSPGVTLQEGRRQLSGD